MMKISIPTPCHENWNNMSPSDNGHHCSSCSKTVIDFSSMSDEEVKHFLINKKEEHLCGRFRNSQLQRIQIELPQNIFQLQIPQWKRFLVACLVAFSSSLFSCEVKNQSDVRVMGGLQMPVPNASLKMPDSILSIDTSKINLPVIDSVSAGYIVGELAPPPDIIITSPEITMGEPAIIQQDTVSSEPQVMGKMRYVPDSFSIPQSNNTAKDSTACQRFL